MNSYILHFVLESDAAFGRGDGLVGVVDAEVQHDKWGCPFLSGRSLKGLLVSECADILYALPKTCRPRWETAAQRLFGCPGDEKLGGAVLSFGDAQLPEDLRTLIVRDIENSGGALKPQDVLESLTTLRWFTAIDETGVPREHSLGTIRVILRGTPFEARLYFSETPSKDDMTLLAACVKSFRRAGTGRNRGLGRLKADLLDCERQCITEEYFQMFRREVLECTR